MRTHHLAPLAVALLMVVAVGCTQSTPALEESAADDTVVTVTLANATCPMQDAPVDEAVTVEWNGQTIGFCCEKCQAAWEALSDDEKTEKLASLENTDETG